MFITIHLPLLQDKLNPLLINEKYQVIFPHFQGFVSPRSACKPPFIPCYPYHCSFFEVLRFPARGAQSYSTQGKAPDSASPAGLWNRASAFLRERQKVFQAPRALKAQINELKTIHGEIASEQGLKDPHSAWREKIEIKKSGSRTPPYTFCFWRPRESISLGALNHLLFVIILHDNCSLQEIQGQIFFPHLSVPF